MLQMCTNDLDSLTAYVGYITLGYKLYILLHAACFVACSSFGIILIVSVSVYLCARGWVIFLYFFLQCTYHLTCVA